MTTRISEQTRAEIRSAWPAIIEGLAAGELVHVLLARLALKPEWLRAYRSSEPNARQEWDDAREQSADSFAEKALDMALNPAQVINPGERGNETGTQPLIIRVDPAHARNAIDTLKWAARIRNPRLYSDKAQLDVNVRTVDLTRIISEANARLANGRAPRILEHEQASA